METKEVTDQVERLYKLARISFSEGNIVGAEKLLILAYELSPTERVETFLTEIQAVLALKSIPEDTNSPRYGNYEEKYSLNTTYNDIEKLPQQNTENMYGYQERKAEIPFDTVNAYKEITVNNKNVSNNTNDEDNDTVTSVLETNIYEQFNCPNSEEISVKEPKSIARSKSDLNHQDAELTEIKKNEILANNVFQMRIKILMMQIGVQEVNGTNNESDCDSKSSIEDTKKDILEYIMYAEYNFFSKNLYLAEQLLEQAEKEYSRNFEKLPQDNTTNINKSEETNQNDQSFECVNIDTVEKLVHKPHYRPKVVIAGDKDDIEKCFKIAETAFAAGNLEKAEKFLLKAKRMSHSALADELIDQVRAAIALRDAPENKYEVSNNTDTVNKEPLHNRSQIQNTKIKIEDNQHAAEQCIEIAKNILSRGDFDKCERLLLKAQRFCPSIDVKDLLAEIRIARASSCFSGQTAKSFPDSANIYDRKHFDHRSQKAEPSTDDKKLEAVKNMKEAIEAYLSGDIKKAETLLLKADRIYPNEKAKTMLSTVLAAKTAGEGATKIVSLSEDALKENNRSSKNLEMYIENNKEEAKKCVRIAQDAVIAGNLEEAKQFYQKALTFYPSKRIEELLRRMHEREAAGEFQGTEERRSITDTNASQGSSFTRPSYTTETQTELHMSKAVIISPNNIPYETVKKNEILLSKHKDTYPSVHANNHSTNFKAIEDSQEKTTFKTYLNEKPTREGKETSEIFSEVNEGLKRCLEVAEEALSSGHLEKTEHFLNKAERMSPGHSRVQKMFNELQKAKDARKSERTSKIGLDFDNSIVKASNPSPNSSSKITDKKKAGEYMQLATDSMNKEHFEDAEVFLLAADDLYPNEYAKELLQKVRAAKAVRFQTVQETPQPLHMHENSDTKKKREANEYINLASEAYTNRNLENAEQFLIMALNLYPSARAQDLLNQVQRARYYRNTGQQSHVSGSGSSSKAISLDVKKNNSKTKKSSDKNFKADRYIEIAINAMKHGNLDEAEKYFAKAEHLRPNSYSNEMLTAVRKEKKALKDFDNDLCNIL